ncbi:MAG: hypothetical protein U0168_08240 [Nannocystaceae bacterium]
MAAGDAARDAEEQPAHQPAIVEAQVPPVQHQEHVLHRPRFAATRAEWRRPP